MDLRKTFNAKAQVEATTGFGTNPSNYGGRFINKDGTANVSKRGIGLFGRISWYHTMINMPRVKFLFVILAFYALVNLAFAMLYFSIGMEYLDGIDVNGSAWDKFWKAYFFSAQTFTTVGYGHISPNGFMTSTLAASEALVGLLSFAIATGLFYARFSKPKAFVRFSHNALIAPYKGGTAFMIRTAPYKNNSLTDAEAKMTLGMVIDVNGRPESKFFTLDMEMRKINSLSLSWTLVHPITEESPLFGFTESDFSTTEGEVIVYLKAFDDLFSTTVAAGTSYTFDEIVYGAKFDLMYSENEANTRTILHLDKINSFKKVDLRA
jgi:inward rectifier potassium channel